MKVTVIHQTTLPLPSGSGLELVGEDLYLIGDDSPHLYRLPRHLAGPLTEWPLFETEHFASGRMPKKLKPDLECLTLLNLEGAPHLLALGSGSKRTRDRGFLISLPRTETEHPKITTLDLQPLYDYFRQLPQITGQQGKLNLEGAAADGRHLILLNRSNKSGEDVALIFNYPEFTEYLLGKRQELPRPEQIYPFELPVSGGVEAGFTGAYLIEDQVFFTAAAEDTEDPVLDGPVHGSFIGRWQLSEPVAGLIRPDIGQVMNADGKPFLGKVESLIIAELTGNRALALAVTDDDLGGSELLELELEWQPRA